MMGSPAVTVYQRELPPSCVPFSSEGGRRLFQEALLGGTLDPYFPLAEEFRPQGTPTSCGLASLAMVLNALKIDPCVAWQGVWRYYDEEVLSRGINLDIVKLRGVEFDEFSHLARSSGCEVESRRVQPSECTNQDIANFRGLIQSICRESSRGFMVAAFSRPALGQTGDGHYSPIAGYHAHEDKVLVLDVARHKHGAYWVDLGALYMAFAVVVQGTGKPRGYHMITKQTQVSLHDGLR
jgi:glutathione gamma-glutamylcysteinyltransferase